MAHFVRHLNTWSVSTRSAAPRRNVRRFVMGNAIRFDGPGSGAKND